MNIATIYTLYGRRAGAELCFEKIIESIYSYNKSVNWTIFCNKQAEYILKEQYPFTQTVYIPYLDNQYKKAFWLEFLSQKEVTSKDFDCFGFQVDAITSLAIGIFQFSQHFMT